MAENSKELHILVVDDDALNRHLVKKMIEKRGHRVSVACDGREAVEFIERTYVDLVIMDCQMPVMDGFEATLHVRSRAGISDTPIIALTGDSSLHVAKRCKEVGVDAFVTKPVTPRLLDAHLRFWSCHRSRKGRVAERVAQPA